MVYSRTFASRTLKSHYQVVAGIFIQQTNKHRQLIPIYKYIYRRFSYKTILTLRLGADERGKRYCQSHRIVPDTFITLKSMSTYQN